MAKPLTLIQDLPLDVLMQILDYFGEKELYEIGVCWKFISSTSFQRLWHTPKCSSIRQLKSILWTLNSKDTIYPYHDWIMGMYISLEIMQTIPENLFHNMQHLVLNIKTLQLANVHLTKTTSELMTNIFLSSHIRQILIENCSVPIISSLSSRIGALDTKLLTRICIKDCYITDVWVKQVVCYTPNLQYFSSQRSGYVSDITILAIAQSCPLIETLIVTLPRHIVQSNTITFLSLQSLATCTHLKKFVCRGQVRISNPESEAWLYSHCPQLEHCDLSF